MTPYCNEDAIYNEIELLNDKFRTLQNEVNILRKQILSVHKEQLVEAKKKEGE